MHSSPVQLPVKSILINSYKNMFKFDLYDLAFGCLFLPPFLSLFLLYNSGDRARSAPAEHIC